MITSDGDTEFAVSSRWAWLNRRFVVVLLASLAARLPLAMTVLAVSLMVIANRGSYSRVGMVVGALVVGQGIGVPLLARAFDRRNGIAIMLGTAVAHGIGLALLPSAGGISLWLLLILAFLSGLLAPPVLPATRKLLPLTVTPAAETRVYSVDAASQEVIFVSGPALVAVLVTQCGARAALYSVSVISVGSAVLLAAAFRWAGLRASSDVATDQRMSPVRVVRLGGALVLLYAIVNLIIVAVEMTVLAWAAAHGDASRSGILIALWATGSLVGGVLLAFSRILIPLPWRYAAMTLALVFVVIGVTVDHLQPLLFSLSLFLGGATLSPVIASIYEELARRTPKESRSEAFGWVAAGGAVGAAASSGISGFGLQFWGPAGVAMFVVVVSTGGWMLSCRLGRGQAR